ncbi:MAG: hypothetical protein PHS79_04205 [Patescibacteria group bacterium]|nr:hypothetical protein [Patescibacteria group bacterium]
MLQHPLATGKSFSVKRRPSVQLVVAILTYSDDVGTESELVKLLNEADIPTAWQTVFVAGTLGKELRPLLHVHRGEGTAFEPSATSVDSISPDNLFASWWTSEGYIGHAPLSEVEYRYMRDLLNPVGKRRVLMVFEASNS